MKGLYAFPRESVGRHFEKDSRAVQHRLSSSIDVSGGGAILVSATPWRPLRALREILWESA